MVSQCWNTAPGPLFCPWVWTIILLYWATLSSDFFLNWDHLKPWEFYQLNGEQSVLLLTWMLFMQLSVIPFYWQMFDKCSMQKCQFLHQVFDTVCRNSAWPKIYMNKSKVQESKWLPAGKSQLKTCFSWLKRNPLVLKKLARKY